MEIRMPEGWVELRHPSLRAELLQFLKELDDPTYQQAAWIERSVDRHLIQGIDPVYAFLYDFTDLGTDPEGEVSYTLFDQEGVTAIRALTQLLDSILDELGNAKTERFIRHPLWPRVVEQANLAFTLLERRGLPIYT